MTSTPLGLIPAAGHARRLGALPVSKEVFPIGVNALGDGSTRARVPVDSLLAGFHEAGVKEGYVVLREGKWDIPAYLGDGEIHDLSLAYLVTPSTQGVPFTIDKAIPFIRDAIVLFGFPDIVFEPQDAFVQLRQRLDDTGSDLGLGLFPARAPSKADMVDLDAHGNVQSLVIKPPQTTLTYTWLLAAWRPTFTRFLHEEVQRRRDVGPTEAGEVHFGHVIKAALAADLDVTAVVVDNASYTDVGTPGALQSVLRQPNGADAPSSYL